MTNLYYYFFTKKSIPFSKFYTKRIHNIVGNLEKFTLSVCNMLSVCNIKRKEPPETDSSFLLRGKNLCEAIACLLVNMERKRSYNQRDLRVSETKSVFLPSVTGRSEFLISAPFIRKNARSLLMPS